MGKSLPYASTVHNFARIISSERINTPKQAKPMSKNKVSHSFSQENSQLKVARVDPAQLSLKMLDSADQTRVPLSQLPSDHFSLQDHQSSGFFDCRSDCLCKIS